MKGLNVLSTLYSMGYFGVMPGTIRVAYSGAKLAVSASITTVCADCMGAFVYAHE